jgi:hypothetical protein
MNEGVNESINESINESKGVNVNKKNVALEKVALEAIYELHTSETDPSYRKLTEDIIGYMLMGKYDKNGNLRELSKQTIGVIKEYYKVADNLYDKYRFAIKGKNERFYTVYKGVNKKLNNDKNRIEFMIPFSTSIEEDNALNWVYDDCCVLVIRFPMDTKFVCIDNPNEGKEVVLPKGVLTIQNEYDKSGVHTYEGVFES